MLSSGESHLEQGDPDEVRNDAGVSQPNWPSSSGTECGSANPTLQVPEVDSTTAELSLFLPTRSHREQPRIVVTKANCTTLKNDWTRVAAQNNSRAMCTGDPAHENPAEQSCVLLCFGLQCNSLATKCASLFGAPKTTPCLTISKLWSPVHTTALGSATLAASKMPSQPGWHRPLLFQICVFPASRSLPYSTFVPTHDAQLPGCETKLMSSRKVIKRFVGS